VPLLPQAVRRRRLIRPITPKRARATRDQFDQAIEHRVEYEAEREKVEGLAEELTGLLPALAEGLDAWLDREDRALAGMAGGIAQVDAALPVYSTALERCLVIGRVLAWLVAAIAGLHGFCLMLGGIPARREPALAPQSQSPDDDAIRPNG
jgi:hypothetical protein